MTAQRWIAAPFWWQERAGVVRRGEERLEVGRKDVELMRQWRRAATDAEVGKALNRDVVAVRADRARLAHANVIVSAEDPRLQTPAVEIEITSHCNANCIMCPRDVLSRNRGFRHMRPDVFDAVVRNIGGRGVRTYYLCGIGEPLLHPKWFDFAARLRRADPDAQIVCVTNGFSIRRRDIPRIVSSDIDVLEVSLHSVDKTAHRAVVRSFAVERALEPVEELLAQLSLRPETALEVKVGQVLVAAHPEPDPGLIAWAEKRGLAFNAWRTWNRAGHVPLEVLVDSETEPRRFSGSNRSPETCSDYAQFLFIDHAGAVLSCCCDFVNETEEFNAARHTLEEILAGRLRQLASGTVLSSICSRCDAPATNKDFFATDYFRVARP